MIYIKPMKKAKLCERSDVYIRDVAEVYAAAKTAEGVKSIKLMNIPRGEDNNYMVSALDLIAAISKEYPGEDVSNVGEMETLIDYHKKKGKGSKVATALKITVISLIMFAGSATAIMSFHTDSQVPMAFRSFYYIFFNEKVDDAQIIDIPYSIGLAFGIIIFFNHFGGKKMTTDPTPVQVEMSTYETSVTDTMLDILNKKSEAKKQKRKN